MVTDYDTSFRTGRIGMVYMRVTDSHCPAEFKDNVAYPCTGFQYSMAVNQIPQITAYVPIGRFFGWSENPSKKYKSPQGLLEWMQSRNESKSRDLFIKCQFYEEALPSAKVNASKDQLIFEGYIVSGGVLYTASGKTGMQVTFNCLGKASKLMIRPLSSYIEVASGSLLNILRRQADLNSVSALNSGIRLAQMNNFEEYLGAKLKGTTITERAIACIGTLKHGLTYDEAKKSYMPPEPDKDSVEALGGRTRLKTSGETCVDPANDPEFTKALYESLVRGTEAGDIWSVLSRTLTSSEFALQLVPRWSCDEENDFKMEICPVKAWKKDYDVWMRGPVIEKFSMANNALDRVSEPEIVMCDFSELHGLTNNDGNKGVLGIYGIYAKDPELNERLQSKNRAKEAEALEKECSKYRVQMMPAPAWLSIAAASPTSNVVEYKGQDNRTKSAEVKQLEEASKPAQEAMEEAQPVPNRNMNDVRSAFNLANSMAELLFCYNYRVMDMAQIEMTPDVRFGRYGGIWLENLLGKVIQVELSNTMAGTDLQIRGTLQSISYSYTAGESSGANYSITLDRVRLANAKMPEIDEYPIYKD